MRSANFSRLCGSNLVAAAGRWDDFIIMMSDGSGPAVVSVRPGRVVRSRALRLVSVLEGWWARVIDRADVVSEGEVVFEAGEAVYYGTTSVHCLPEPRPEPIETLSIETLARLLLADPHARLRLVRLAHREAVGRAPGRLCALRVELQARGVGAARARPSAVIEVMIEVSAALCAGSMPVTPPATGSDGPQAGLKRR